MHAASEVQKFIEEQNKLSTLRYITCGSVDDGKSTLLGRMLYEAQLIFEDQIESLLADSKKLGTQGEEIDFALLVDGLAAEREQGITIDVAYRFFSSRKRKFIVADSPGHEQYTRNMVTAASNAEAAIILIDARNGILEQTKRHSFIANLVGIKNIIVAVNKMDLVNYDKNTYENIIENYQTEILSNLEFEDVRFIPVSALKGDNIVKKSKNMKWYKSLPLLSLLEEIKIKDSSSNDFSMPVQYVNRPNLDFRGFCGTVASGKIRLGEKLVAVKSKQKASVKQIFYGDKSVKEAQHGNSVTLTLSKEIDISRGDVLVKDCDDYDSASLFHTNFIWFDINECFQNRNYIFKSVGNTCGCQILNIKNKINVNNYEKVATHSLKMNDIAECEIQLDSSLPLKSYAENKSLGNFILIDKISNLTVGAGTINYPLRRSANIKWQDTTINLKTRRELLNQNSFVIWFTGKSASGKSTISNELEKRLASNGKLTYLLDGDNLRHGLNKDLGFKEEDRIENLRRIGEVAKILYDSGVIVIASFISPYKKDRDAIRAKFLEGEFVEIFVDAPLQTLKDRDPKGLYKKALKGEIPNFTGINAPYEEPENPEIVIDTANLQPDQAVNNIISYLKEKGCI